MKNEYIETIKAAGFHDVTIIDETLFPVDCMANDPAALVIVEDLALSPEMIPGTADSVVSIKVAGVKPN
ncbi:hypothetical protein ACFLYR_05390 [Chloroflexota bacterium]